MKKKIKKPIPFDFVLEELGDISPYTKPMFGSYGVYVGDKIVLILRERESSAIDNGVWVCTTIEHHQSLKKDFPSMRPIKIFEDGGPQGWQVLPLKSKDFEESVMRVCELIKKKDPRIGKIPQSKLKKLK